MIFDSIFEYGVSMHGEKLAEKCEDGDIRRVMIRYQLGKRRKYFYYKRISGPPGEYIFMQRKMKPDRYEPLSGRMSVDVLDYILNDIYPQQDRFTSRSNEDKIQILQYCGKATQDVIDSIELTLRLRKENEFKVEEIPF